MKNYLFGVDIGGTTIKMGFFNNAGELLAKWEIPTNTENNGSNILGDIAEAIKAKLTENNSSLDDVEGVGVGSSSPGVGVGSSNALTLDGVYLMHRKS